MLDLFYFLLYIFHYFIIMNNIKLQKPIIISDLGAPPAPEVSQTSAKDLPDSPSLVNTQSLQAIDNRQVAVPRPLYFWEEPSNYELPKPHRDFFEAFNRLEKVIVDYVFSVELELNLESIRHNREDSVLESKEHKKLVNYERLWKQFINDSYGLSFRRRLHKMAAEDIKTKLDAFKVDELKGEIKRILDLQDTYKKTLSFDEIRRIERTLKRLCESLDEKAVSLSQLWLNYFKHLTFFHYFEERIKEQAAMRAFLSKTRDDLKKAWLDLKPAEYYFEERSSSLAPKALAELAKDEILPLPKNDTYQELYRQLQAYEGLVKTVSENIQPRIEGLKNIAQTAGRLAKSNTPHTATLQEITARANLKADYLKKLLVLEQEAYRRAYSLLDPSTPETLQPVRLRDSLLSSLDPAKRLGLNIALDLWQKELRKDPNLPNFWIWLEGEDTAALGKDLRHSFIQKHLKQVYFKDGKAYNELFRSFAKDSKGLIADGSYVYTISQAGDLYILPALEEQTLQNFQKQSKVLFKPVAYTEEERFNLLGELNHNTVLEGENVLSAGVMSIKEGSIVSINTNSGHYRPLMIKNLRPALERFSTKYPHVLSEKTIIGNHNNSITLSFAEFKTASLKDLGEHYTPQDSPPLNMLDLGFKPITSS